MTEDKQFHLSTEIVAVPLVILSMHYIHFQCVAGGIKIPAYDLGRL